MLFNHLFVLISFSFLTLGGVLGRFTRKSSKVEQILVFLAMLLMGPVIFIQEGKIFGLISLYLLLLIIQIIEIFKRTKSTINLYISSLFLIMHLLSISKKLIYDLSLVGALIFLLLIIFSENEKIRNLKDSKKLSISLFFLLSLFFIFILSMAASTNFISYESFSIHLPIQYSIALLFLFLSLFFLVFSFPFMSINKIFDESQFDLRFVLAISIFYYGFLSKFIWVFQNLFKNLPSLSQKYFETIGGLAFGLCLIVWFWFSFSKKRKWENKFVSLYFLNFSISLLIIFSELNEEITDKFQWLLLSTIIPFIIWSFLSNLDKYYSVPEFCYSLVLLGLCGAPLGAVFFSKILLSLPFYKQDSFFEYTIYLGLSQIASFWVISEFFKRIKTNHLTPGKLNLPS